MRAISSAVCRSVSAGRVAVVHVRNLNRSSQVSVEEQPGDRQADPDDKAEQADDVDRASRARPSAQSFLKFDARPMAKNVITKK